MAAVAKLKRAASLPRMKDGRRPPMHTDAVSEGEKASNGDDAKGDVSPAQERKEVEEDTAEPGPEPVAEAEVKVQAEVEVEVEPEAEAEPEADVEDAEAVSPSPAARSKRRSRSRSRSRGSKDLRGKVRATQSPTPTPPAAGDSSQDESSFPPPLNLAALTPLMSPIPSHILELQRSRLLRSPTPTQDPSMLGSGLSPHSPVMPPSLEALQRGLLRSNSAGNAAGRMMALHKLTGGTESYDPSGSSSPSPSPFGKLSRSNTVTGGERTAARQLMLSRLGGRIGKETDGEQASGEDRSAPSPTPKRRRRRSRRGSQGANTGVSDSEFLSTSPNTPTIPQAPLPSAFDALSELLLRSRSVTPFQYISTLTYEVEEGPEPPQPVHQEPERHERTRRRSVVVEEEDEDERYPPQRTHLGYSGPQLQHTPALRLPHPSDAPSNDPSDSPSPLGVSVSVLQNRSPQTPNRTPPGNDAFPRSPYATPLREIFSREDDEEVLYQPDTLRPRTPYEENSEREISWVASPVPELDSMPISIEDEDEDEESNGRGEEEDQDLEELPNSPGSRNYYSPQEQEVYDDSPRVSSSSKSLVVESETSLAASPSHVSLAISGAADSQTASFTPASDASTSPPTYPMRLSVASRSPMYGEFPDWDDRVGNTDPNTKRIGDSPSTWEKVKSTFSRAGSSAGRRSRTNSIVTRERREQADSINRESGASLNSAKTDRVDPFAVAQSPPPLMLSSSASASISSLAPPLAPGPRGGPSPIPPLNPANKSKYQHAKLFPFGMTTAPEEQRSRIPSASASSPDIVMSSSNEENLPPLSASTPGHTPEITRERKLSHQTSDTHLMARFNTGGPSSHPDGPPRSPSQTGGSYKLPMTLSAVKQWLNRKQSSAPSIPAPAPVPRPHTPSQKLLAPDVMRRQESQQSADWEEVTPTSPVGETFVRLGQNGNRDIPLTTNPTIPRSEHTDTEKTPKAKKMKMTLPPSDQSDNGISFFDDSPLSPPSRPDPFSSTTPDPSSSLSDYPAHSTSESSSTTSSQYSLGPLGPQGAVFLQKIDEELVRSHSRIWGTSTENPPRKLLLSTPVFQVVNHNTVKDRFLFLFSDILVIAKPVFTDQETRVLHDRKFTVKSVVQLSQLRFTDGRAETGAEETNGSKARTRIASFVHNFSKDPEGAIDLLYSRSGHGEDAAAAGQLLFKTLDLDRVRLGEYLARRTSKAVLKTYLDFFRFYGLRVDHALRIFLLSIHIPRTSHYQHNGHNALEYLLETFAGRWYEANARLVDYNKDHAHRFVRAIVQLNNSLHGEIANEPGFTETSRRDVTSDDFVVAFRRYDQKSSVSDGLLQDVYESILNERLSHSPNAGSPVEVIAIKRAIPASLTWRIDSDPIVFRIPQADPGLSIELYGQDMIFEPPVLNFGKSSEVSFRVKAVTLGPKSIIMRRSGPSAIKYTGLPLSCPVLVERAFMRHTIQVAFQNHNGVKRRYMFGMDDSVVRYQWIAHVRKQIDKATEASKSGAPRFRRAAEALAFRLLQETLLASPPVPANSNKNSQRANAYTNLGSRFSHDRVAAASDGFQLTPLHVRSKSRSKVYHRHGAGKNELDLSQPISHRGSRDEHDERLDVSQGPLWSFEDLKTLCTKNGSIAAILSYLQAPTSSAAYES
ncbi:hypothetical protein DXG03_003124 [Asterophora parasitica]|uniref:SEC7 domain-containing protein n=1 Tax=Asterophora parasitica TaxID=117018 RepID=A0A9P7GH62_9AGAR|nr:hypothetical protein DXG03_003124 [Asterophora parasitica]